MATHDAARNDKRVRVRVRVYSPICGNFARSLIKINTYIHEREPKNQSTFLPLTLSPSKTLSPPSPPFSTTRLCVYSHFYSIRFSFVNFVFLFISSFLPFEQQKAIGKTIFTYNLNRARKMHKRPTKIIFINMLLCVLCVCVCVCARIGMTGGSNERTQTPM